MSEPAQAIGPDSSFASATAGATTTVPDPARTDLVAHATPYATAALTVLRKQTPSAIAPGTTICRGDASRPPGTAAEAASVAAVLRRGLSVTALATGAAGPTVSGANGVSAHDDVGELGKKDGVAGARLDPRSSRGSVARRYGVVLDVQRCAP